MPNGFVYIERSWGSLFYKVFGQKTKLQAKAECSKYGNSSLPIPRSFEENEFYRTHFGNKRLWLDISKNENSHFESPNKRIFSSIIQTNTFSIQIDKYDWMNFNLTENSGEVILLENGQYDATSEYKLNEAVCVNNIEPKHNCMKCSNGGFCRHTNNVKNQTACACSKTRHGDNCEVDLCAHCQNGGTCRIKDKTNEIECICPSPFDGEHCEIDLENLGNFTLIEKPWGSFHFKFLGKLRRNSAERACSKMGDSVHLPSPRFPEENDFYRTHFGNVSLWIDVPEIMISFVHTNTDHVIINNFDWINLNVTDKSFLTEFIMNGTGQWEQTDTNLFLDSVCVQNIQPENNCSRCGDDAFCRFTDFSKNVTECICPFHRTGLNCEIDLCSNCQNKGFCKISKTNQIECICPRPFGGVHCEENLCPHCLNGGYCEVTPGQNESECVCPVKYHGKYCEIEKYCK